MKISKRNNGFHGNFMKSLTLLSVLFDLIYFLVKITYSAKKIHIDIQSNFEVHVPCNRLLAAGSSNLAL